MSSGLVIAVRVSAYAAVFAVMALWEWWAPLRIRARIQTSQVAIDHRRVDRGCPD